MHYAVKFFQKLYPLRMYVVEGFAPAKSLLIAPAVQVVFVSTCTNFWDCGSVALDDISVSLGDCDLTAGNFILTDAHRISGSYSVSMINTLSLESHFGWPSAGLLLSVPGHCNFEMGHCGYIQDKEDDKGDWVLVRGPTPTSYTGPKGDHTTGVGEYPMPYNIP